MDLGNLYFNVGLKDNTPSDFAKIKAALDKKFVIKPVLDESTLARMLSDMQKDQGLSLRLRATLDTPSLSKAILDAAKRMPALRLRVLLSGTDVSTVTGLTAAMRQLQQEVTRLGANMGRATPQMDGLTTAMRRQSSVASQLRTQVASYFSIYGAERFLRSVMEIGGEFEKQHIALRSIIGDTQKADAIFDQIKSLAVESPFEFKDLTSYARQLSAFAIPYEELYETTKRLADVSAGLGVDMGRIILAYGQVRSASFLRGQEVRQFTEAGIPLLDELAKKFTELEGRVVKVGEVFDRISNREVPFEMVKDVLWDLTSEGGKFFEMQEVLAESLAGKVSNLKDAYHIMLSEIAEGNNTILKSGVSLLSGMMSHWQTIGTVLLSVMGAYGVMKVSMAALNTIQTAYAMKTRGLTQLEVQNTIAVLTRTKAVKGLTAAQEKELALATAANKVMRINPYVAAGVAVTALAAGLYSLYQESTRVSRELREVSESAAAVARTTESGLNALVYKLSQTTEGTMAYADVIREINRRYGDYLPNILSEAAAYDEVAKAAGAAKEAIVGKAKAQAFDSGTQKIDDEFAKDIVNATTGLRNNISSLLRVSEDEASVIAQKIRERLQSAVEDGIEISGAWINEELVKIDERFRNGTYRTLASPTTGGVMIVDNVLAEARRVVKVYEDAQKMRAELDRDLNMSFGTDGKYEIDGVRKAIDKYKAERALLAHDDIEGERKARKTMYEEMRKAYLDVNDLEKMRDVESRIDELSKEKEGWVKLAEEAANASKAIDGIDYRVKRLVPDDKEQNDQISYLDRIANAYRDVQDEIKKINHIPKESRTGDLNAKLAKLAFDKQQFDVLAKKLGVDFGDFGNAGAKKDRKKGDDTLAEMAERNANLWKKAMESYRDYAKVVGKSEAIKKVREEGRFAGLDFDPEKYREALAGIDAGLAGSTKERLRIKASIREVIGDFDLSKVRESASKAIDVMERELSERSSKWELFDKFMTATGDREVSATFAFGGAVQAKDYLADYAAELKKVAGETFKVQLDFDVESKRTVREQIGELYDGLPEELRKQVDKLDVIVGESNSKKLENLAELLGKTADYEAQRASVYRKYDDQILKTSGETKEKLISNRKAELSAIKAEEVRNSKPFKALQGNLSYYSTEALKEYVDQARTLLSEVTDLTEEEMKRQRDLIFRSSDELAKRNPFIEMKEAYKRYLAARKKGDKEGAEMEWKTFEAGLGEAKSLVDGLGSAVGGLVGVFDGDVGQFVGGLAAAIGDFASGVTSLGKEGGSLGDKIRGISGVLGAVTFLVGSSMNAREDRKGQYSDYALDMVEMSHAFFLLMEKINDLDYENIFGVNSIKKSYDAWSKMTEVSAEYEKQVASISGMMVTTYKPNWWNAFWYAGTERGTERMQNINDYAPGIFDEKGFNVERAREVLSASNKLSAEQREEIGYAIELEERYLELAELIKEDLQETFGGISAGLMDGLIDSIKGGTDSWDKFGDAGVAALERVGEQLLYTIFMAEKFDKLQEDLLATSGIEDPEKRAKAQMDIVDAYYDDMEAGWDEMRNFGQYWKEEAAKRGFDIWQPDKDKSAGGLSAEAEKITEDSANLLGSYLNSVRGDVSVIKEMYERVLEEMVPEVGNRLALIQADIMRIQENTWRNAAAAEKIEELIRGGMNGTKKFYVS
jgi:hypothetical protein